MIAPPIPPAADCPRRARLQKLSGRPFLMICYVVAYLDRINVTYAKLQMECRSRIQPDRVRTRGGQFFIGYFFFEVPSNLIMYRVGAKLSIARIIDHMGSAFGVFRLHQDAVLVLYCPLSPRSGRGRLLPGGNPLSHLLVSLKAACADRRCVYVGDSHCGHPWQSASGWIMSTPSTKLPA